MSKGISRLGLRWVAAMTLRDTVEPFPAIFEQVPYHTLAVRVPEGFAFTFDRLWWLERPIAGSTPREVIER